MRAFKKGWMKRGRKGLVLVEVAYSSSSSSPATEKQLQSTLEELAEANDLISELRKPPPEVHGADRQELLRLLDRRYGHAALREVSSLHV